MDLAAVARRILLAVASFVATATLVWLGGEAWFRYFHEMGDVHAPPDWTDFDEARGWKLRPGTYSYFDVAAFTRSTIEIGELGIRSAPVALEVPDGKRRLTVLGDSFVFAAALEAHERFTGRLEAMAGPGVEVISAGVPGYGTGQEVLLLQDLAARGLETGDTVVLAFFMNDVTDNAGFEYGTFIPASWIPAFHVDEAGQLRGTRPERHEDPPPSVRLARSSLFAQFVSNRAQVVMSRFPVLLDVMEALGRPPVFGRVPNVIGGWYEDGWEAEWERTVRILEYLDDWLRARDTRLVIAAIPSPFQVEKTFRALIEKQRGRDDRFEAWFDDPDRPQRLLAELCGRRDIEFIDTTAALRERNADEAVFFLREGHLNQAGSEVVAQVLHGRLFPGR